MANKFAISTVFSAINKVSTTVKKMTADVGGLGVVAARTQSVLGGIGKAGMGVATGVGIAGAAAGAAALGIYKLAESVSTLGDDVAKTARSLGLSTDALQEFRYIGERSGVSVDEMDIALKKLTINVGDATSEVAKSLAKMGISAAAIRKAGPDEALNMVADGMARIKDPAKRAAIAVDLFGKNGVKMVNVLGEGRAGMAALAKEAHRVGYVLDGPTLDASEKLNDMILNMKTSFKALGNQVASKFMPLVTSAVVGITDFMVENRAIFDDVANGLVGVFQGIGPLAGRLLPSMAAALSKIGGLLNRVFTSAGPLVGKLGDALMTAIDGLLPTFDKLLDAAMPVITQIMDGFVDIIPSLIQVAATLSRVLIPVFRLLKPVLDIIIPIIDVLAKALVGFSEIIKIMFEPIIKFLTWILDKIPGAISALQTAPAGAPSSYVPDMSGGAASEFYGSPVPISSQTSTINRNTRNTLDVNFNNPPPGTTARSTGPSAPPITINTGSMAHPRGL